MVNFSFRSRYGLAIRISAIFLALALFAAGCSNDDDEKHENLIDTVKLSAYESVWIDSYSFDQSGGKINEIIFDSDEYIYVDGIKVGGTIYYEFVGNRATTYGDYISHFAGVWNLYNKTASVVLPPLYPIAGAFPSGDYQFKLTNITGSKANVDIYKITKTDSDLSSGSFDINLFVYTDGDDNEVIPSTSEAYNVISYMNQIFNPAGVSIGTMNVEFIKDTRALSQVLTDDGMYEFLESASVGTAGRDDSGINCFLFPRLSGDTLGVDGAIPGPGVIHGTAASGLIAQAGSLGFSAGGLSEHETDQMILAKILAHEIGHYFGLFHTTEYNGESVGALSDTPQCGTQNDANGDGYVAGSECRGKGAEYLMFWSYDGSLVRTGDFQILLSSQEGQVSNTHPAVN